MKNRLGHVQFVFLVNLALLIGANSVVATDTDLFMKKTIQKMLGAMKTADLELFIAEGTDRLKKGTTQEIMDGLKEKYSERIAKGFDANYLGVLKQEGYQVHLWKLTFKDQSDDILLRLVLKEKQVAGFFLQ